MRLHGARNQTSSDTNSSCVDVMNAKTRNIVYLIIERSITSQVVNKILGNDDPASAFLGTPDAPVSATQMQGISSQVFNDLRATSYALAVHETPSIFYFPNLPSMPDPNVAYDHIVVLHADYMPTPTSIELASFRFGKPGAPSFFLRDLALMTLNVHNLRPAYSWKTANCFWFSRTLMDVIAGMTDPLAKMRLRG